MKGDRMITDVTRGSIKVEMSGRQVTVAGEMFFPENGKMGFSVYADRLVNWDFPHNSVAISAAERQVILDVLRDGFEKGGHILVIE